MTRAAATVRRPRRRPSACVWCAARFANIVDLLDHVDRWHLEDETSAASVMRRHAAPAASGIEIVTAIDAPSSPRRLAS